MKGKTSVLARGLTRETVRRTIDRDMSGNQEANRRFGQDVPPTGRAARFRWLVKAYRQKLGKALVLEKPMGTGIGKKADAHMFVVWSVLDDARQFGLGIFMVRARDMNILDYCPMFVPPHAMERIFDRIGSHDTSAVVAELSPATGAIIDIWSIMNSNQISPLLEGKSQIILPTPNGAIVVKKAEEMKIKPHLVAVTWVSDDQLFPDQRNFIRSLQDVLDGDPWHRAANLVESFGRVRRPHVG